MNMSKTEWYKNRILWRAKKNKLLYQDKVYLYECIEHNKLNLIEQLVGKETEILVIMWEASNCWTLLGVDSIYSFYNGSLRSCKYDDIKKKLHARMPEKYKNNKDIKKNVEFIYLEDPKISVWAPKGSPLMALMNILLMFPLRFGDSEA